MQMHVGQIRYSIGTILIRYLFAAGACAARGAAVGTGACAARGAWSRPGPRLAVLHAPPPPTPHPPHAPRPTPHPARSPPPALLCSKIVLEAMSDSAWHQLHVRLHLPAPPAPPSLQHIV